MKKLLVLATLVVFDCVAQVVSDTIRVPVHRYHNIDNQNGRHWATLDNSPVSPHVFEIEPIQTPLRILFSSESSPLYLDVQKGSPDDEQPDSDVKQDRSGATPSRVGSAANASPIHIPVDTRAGSGANSGAGSNAGSGAGSGADMGRGSFLYNDQEYRIVDQYERYVPVKVRDRSEEVLSTERQFVFRPVNANPKQTNADSMQKKKDLKKVKLNTTKPEKPITTKTTEAPVTDAPVDETTAKFGARISRNADKAKTSSN